MTRPTARGTALAVVAAATYVAARVLGTWELYLVALAFAGMIGVSWGLVLAGARRLQIDRRVTPDRPVDGDPLELSFCARSGSPLPGLQVTLTGATGALGRGAGPVTIESLSSRSERTATAGPWRALRGVHRLPPFIAVVEDPLGLVRARRRAGEPLTVTVTPRLEELASCAACTDAGIRHGAGRRRLPTRDASEFRGIRPHNPGEPLNRVDWKSTAKTGSLMLREMEAATEDDLTVLLSGAAACDSGEPPDSAFEAAVRAAGSIAAFTLRTGHAVSLLLPETDWRPIRLSPDAASRRRLATVLAGAQPRGPERLGPSLPAIVSGRRGGRRHSRARVLALVVLSLDRGLADALGRLREQGVAVSVVHVVGPERPAADHDLRRALAAAGVLYLPLGRDDPVHQALSIRPVSRRARVG